MNCTPRWLVRRCLLLSFGLASLLMGMECEQQRLEGLDNGRMIADGYELEPIAIPWLVTVHESVDDPEYGFDRNLITQAIDWWNDQELGVLFVLDDEVSVETDGVLSVEVGFTTSDYEWMDDGSGEMAVPGVFDYAYDEGFLIYGLIIVSSDHTYHDQTVLDTLKHELGHTLGLADDPGPPATVDLNSVMGSPLVEDGRVTDHDWELLHDTI